MTTSRKLTSETERRRLALHAYTALEMMSRGEAGLEEWKDLSDAVNVTEALCDLGKLDAERHRPLIDRAVEGMAEAVEFYGELGRLRMSERCLEALREVVCAYDQAIGRFSEGTLVEARAHVVVKVAKAKHRADPSVRVVAP